MGSHFAPRHHSLHKKNKKVEGGLAQTKCSCSCLLTYKVGLNISLRNASIRGTPPIFTFEIAVEYVQLKLQLKWGKEKKLFLSDKVH